jgi:hypothetical protein
VVGGGCAENRKKKDEGWRGEDEEEREEMCTWMGTYWIVHF